MADESIVAVEAKHFADLERDVLITNTSTIDQVMRTIEEHGKSGSRALLDQDPEYRQPIPYVLVEQNSKLRCVLMQRGKGQGESRLWGKYCLGAGGHVCAGDSVRYTALKEVTEELGLPLSFLEPAGVMISTGGMVEDVHIGIFFEARTNYIKFISPEHADQNPVWVTKDDLFKKYEGMEKWSQIVMRGRFNYDPTIHSTPAYAAQVGN